MLNTQQRQDPVKFGHPLDLQYGGKYGSFGEADVFYKEILLHLRPYFNTVANFLPE
jgi:hypothetical protein